MSRAAERVVLISIYALCGSMAVVAWGYSLRDTLGPGSGFFPFWLGLIGIALAATLLVQSARGRGLAEGGQPVLPRGEGAVRIAVLVAGLVAAALLLQPLGFRLTTLAFTAVLLYALGVRRIVLLAVVALAAGFGVFHVFYHWLKVPLPVGLLGI